MNDGFLSALAARRRFGMRPGLDSISALCRALGDPQREFPSVHVAGTNGKGAVCAIIDAAIRDGGARPVGRYTSPHLVAINERFFIDGAPVDDATLERLAQRVQDATEAMPDDSSPTFFEALTAVAFLLFAERKTRCAVLECGLGGRLDATNVCSPELCVITRIGLDHCDWLGDTVEKIAAEKAGIVKPGVPVVLGRNEAPVVSVIRRRAEELGAPFFYAPDVASEADVPADFPLRGSFNRENAVTASAALKVLGKGTPFRLPSAVTWPGRFQRVGGFIVDGAHNPPAARALAEALREDGRVERSLDLVFGACADKDVDCVLRTLAPFARRGFAVRTGNPRSLAADAMAERMRAAGIDATPCETLADALGAARPDALVCGSLFLAGEALVALGAYPWPAPRFDPNETR